MVFKALKVTNMRIPDWTPEAKPQPDDLVQAILKRRGGEFINLDKALLWSEPLARGWNVYRILNITSSCEIHRRWI